MSVIMLSSNGEKGNKKTPRGQIGVFTNKSAIHFIGRSSESS